MSGGQRRGFALGRAPAFAGHLGVYLWFMSRSPSRVEEVGQREALVVDGGLCRGPLVSRRQPVRIQNRELVSDQLLSPERMQGGEMLMNGVIDVRRVAQLLAGAPRRVIA